MPVRALLCFGLQKGLIFLVISATPKYIIQNSLQKSLKGNPDRHLLMLFEVFEFGLTSVKMVKSNSVESSGHIMWWAAEVMPIVV